MEIFKNRNGKDRAITRIDFQTIRVTGENTPYRTSTDNRGNLTMFDFDGGPAYTIGGRIFFEKMSYKINSIKILSTDQPLNEVVLKVSPQYSNTI